MRAGEREGGESGGEGGCVCVSRGEGVYVSGGERVCESGGEGGCVCVREEGEDKNHL